MAAKKGSGAGSESGQSVLEFLITLPLMLGMVVLMVRVNSVIQVSIVNQQYVRAHTLWLAHNSSIYPELRFQDDMAEKGYNQMVLGVSAEKVAEVGDTSPVATEIRINRTPGSVRGSTAAQEEPTLRHQVRVRTTVTLCTQSNVTEGPGGETVRLGDLREGVDPRSFLYCRGPF